MDLEQRQQLIRDAADLREEIARLQSRWQSLMGDAEAADSDDSIEEYAWERMQAVESYLSDAHEAAEALLSPETWGDPEEEDEDEEGDVIPYEPPGEDDHDFR